LSLILDLLHAEVALKRIQQGIRWLAAAPLILLTGVACLAGLGWVALVLYYNARFTLDRVSTVFVYQADQRYPVPTGGFSAPAWVQPLLQDLSLVAPSLVAVSLFFMAIGAFRLLRSDLQRTACGTHFPFPSSYRGYYIQFGLLGTIVGFVIAFSHITPSLQGQSQLLLDALGTALWSTLVAIVLAYGICPLMELLYQWWLRMRSGSDAGAEWDAVSALDVLRSRTLSATSSLDEFARSVQALNAELNAVQLNSRLAKLEHGLAGTETDYTTCKRHLADLHARQRELQNQLDGMARWQQDWERRLDELLAQLELDRSAQVGTEQRIDAIERSLGKLLDQLKQALAP